MLKRLKRIFSSVKIENVLITPYRSYGTRHHLYLLGRALDDVPLKIVEDQNIFTTLKNAYKQFDSFEIRNAKIRVKVGDEIELNGKTNCEGFYLFDENTSTDLSNLVNEEGWLTTEIYYENEISPETNLVNDHFQGEILIPEKTAEYGVISDIDDTIMHTGVTSFLKWRLLKNSLLTNAYDRIPLKGAAELYQKFHLGKSGQNKNPIFYLSNSPWNLYQYLKLFLDFNKFPKGPILLRNFRGPFDRSLRPEKPHKQKEIFNILKTYPDFKFILIGDSGEHDASIYTEIAEKYPERILAIYLRSVRHKKSMNRVHGVIDGFKSVPVLMVEKSIDAEAHARENGYI